MLLPRLTNPVHQNKRLRQGRDRERFREVSRERLSLDFAHRYVVGVGGATKRKRRRRDQLSRTTRLNRAERRSRLTELQRKDDRLERIR